MMSVGIHMSIHLLTQIGGRSNSIRISMGMNQYQTHCQCFVFVLILARPRPTQWQSELMAREGFVDKHVGMTALKSCVECFGHVAVEPCYAAGGARISSQNPTRQ